VRGFLLYAPLPAHFRPGQQDASDLFHYLTTTCSLFETFLTGIATYIENYPQCRPSNVQSLPFTTHDVHVKDAKNETGPVSLEQLILDSSAPDTAFCVRFVYKLMENRKFKQSQ